MGLRVRWECKVARDPIAAAFKGALTTYLRLLTGSRVHGLELGSDNIGVAVGILVLGPVNTSGFKRSGVYIIL